MSSSIEQIPPRHRDRVVVTNLAKPRNERATMDRVIVADFSEAGAAGHANYSVVALDLLAARVRRHAAKPGNPASELAGRLADDIVDGLLRIAGFRVERGVSVAAAGAAVIIYRTSWCGFCRKAAEYLRDRGVRFEEKDIEQDPDAAAELSEKLERSGLAHQGVPVLDIGGELVLGFDRERIDKLLREKGQ